jgi:phage terminase large subunit-like protein
VVALYFPRQQKVPKPVLLTWAWAPEDVEHHKILKERYGYQEWVDGKFLKLTSGVRTDYTVLREDILQLDRDYAIEELAFDPRYSFQLVQELEQKGVAVVEHKQGPVSMTGPIQEFQRQILGRDFVHGMNPLLTFNVDNLVVKNDGRDNLMCEKPSNPNSPRKIDAAVASIMAIGRAAANPTVGQESGKVFFG